MNYRGLLNDVLVITERQAVLAGHRQYVSMIKRGEQALKQLLSAIEPGKRTQVATILIKAILKRVAGRPWSASPKWAPVRESILDEDLTLNQQANNAIDSITTGVAGLKLDTPTTRKLLSAMIGRLKGSMEWNVNTPDWQNRNMLAAVRKYVGLAIDQGKGILRFDSGKLNKSSQQNLTRYYGTALQELGLTGNWYNNKDGSTILDFRAALALKGLAESEVGLAKQQGPDQHGRLVLNVGSVAQKLVAKGMIDAKTAEFVFGNQLRKLGIDPNRVLLTADEPGSRGTATSQPAPQRNDFRPSTRLDVDRTPQPRTPTPHKPMGRGSMGRGSMGRGSMGRGSMGRGSMGRGPVYNGKRDIYGEPIGREEDWELPLL